MNSDNTMDAAGDLELIESYLQNKLTQEQIILFEERLRNEPAFWETVELQRRIILTVKEAAIVNLLQQTKRDLFRKSSGERTHFALDILSAKSEIPELRIAAKIDLSGKTEDPSILGFWSIPYHGDPNPPFHIHKAYRKTLFLFTRILPATESYTFHYQFKNSSDKFAQLHLYGNFDPATLTLIYNPQHNRDNLKLRIGTKEYPLKINGDIAPLSEADKSA